MSFDFNEDYILENEYVRLRPLQEDDVQYLLEYSIHEPEIWTYSLVQANSELNLKKYLNLAIQGRSNHNAYPFIVFDKVNNKYAGSTRFYDIQLENSSLQLGYTWYGSQFQRTGLNRHCKYLLLDFAFDGMELERVEFRADNENKKSIAAMLGIGCTKEGVLRSHGYKPDGSRRDSIVLSILKDEWKNKVKIDLKEKCKPLSLIGK